MSVHSRFYYSNSHWTDNDVSLYTGRLISWKILLSSRVSGELSGGLKAGSVDGNANASCLQHNQLQLPRDSERSNGGENDNRKAQVTKRKTIAMHSLKAYVRGCGGGRILKKASASEHGDGSCEGNGEGPMARRFPRAESEITAPGALLGSYLISVL